MSCKKLCRCPDGDRVADHDAEQIGSDDAENAAQSRPDQPLQADRAQTHLEQNHRPRPAPGPLRYPLALADRRAEAKNMPSPLRKTNKPRIMTRSKRTSLKALYQLRTGGSECTVPDADPWRCSRLSPAENLPVDTYIKLMKVPATIRMPKPDGPVQPAPHGK